MFILEQIILFNVFVHHVFFRLDVLLHFLLVYLVEQYLRLLLRLRSVVHLVCELTSRFFVVLLFFIASSFALYLLLRFNQLGPRLGLSFVQVVLHFAVTGEDPHS